MLCQTQRCLLLVVLVYMMLVVVVRYINVVGWYDAVSIYVGCGYVVGM